MFSSLNAFLRTLIFAGLLGVSGWWTLTLRSRLFENDEALDRSRQEASSLAIQLEDRDREIRRLDLSLQANTEEIEALEATLVEREATIRERDQRIESLDLALSLLKVDHRLAKLEVLSQTTESADGQPVRTTLRFTEVGPDGEPLGEGRLLTVEGKMVYVETLTVKFQDSYVEQGDALRGTSICLFNRVFGENQNPSEGQRLDTVGEQPLVYTGDNTPNPLHREIWERFWDYANDTELANEIGVRAVHGEAPFIEARPGKTYWLELRSSGGLNITSK